VERFGPGKELTEKREAGGVGDPTRRRGSHDQLACREPGCQRDENDCEQPSTRERGGEEDEGLLEMTRRPPDESL
jgi:hypothetical protein